MNLKGHWNRTYVPLSDHQDDGFAKRRPTVFFQESSLGNLMRVNPRPKFRATFACGVWLLGVPASPDKSSGFPFHWNIIREGFRDCRRHRR